MDRALLTNDELKRVIPWVVRFGIPPSHLAPYTTKTKRSVAEIGRRMGYYREGPRA